MNQNQTQTTIMSPLSNESLFVIGDTEPYTNYNSDNDEEYYDVYDRIFMEDQDFVDSDKENNQYLIGGCYNIQDNKETLNDIYLSIAMTPVTFFKTEYKITREYLKEYGLGINYPTNLLFRNNPLLRGQELPSLEIMQMKLKNDGQFCHNVVVIKTTWLRLVQRRWRNIFNERKKIVKERMKVSSHKYWELHGKYPNSCRYIPNYRGMLNNLAIKND